MKKLGLVFAGGGGKGAYEIGVWKALKEYDFDTKIEAVSGTSVGALNGALFVKGDLKQGLRVWQEMSPEKILQINPEKVLSILTKFNLSTAIVSLIAEKLGFLKSEGVFGQKGLENIIKSSLSKGDLQGKIPIYICATDVSSKLSWQPLYKKLNDLEYEKVVQYLLATAAIPVAFPKTIVEDVELLDGFLTDNTPAKPLIEEEQCDTLIVVLLGRSASIAHLKKEYPNVKFWEIVPSGDTKESLGSLNFESKRANTLIEMGYNDTKAILQNLAEFMQIEEEFLQKGLTLHTQEKQFKTLTQEDKALENSSKNSLELFSQKLALELKAHEQELIGTNLDAVLEKMGENSTELSKFAFDAVTSLASNSGKINYQQEQGNFSRILGGITGSNHQLQADINLNFSQAIYANTQLIKKLAQRDNLTLDMCISLGNRVNFLAHKQKQLQLQDTKQLLMIEELRGALLTLAELTKNAIRQNTQRIEKLEYGQTLLNWSHHLKSSIRGLNDYDALMRILGSYYSIVQGSFNKANSEFLYSALVNLGFENREFKSREFIEYATQKSVDELLLFENIPSSEVLPLPKSHEVYTPLFATLSTLYEKKDVLLDDVIERMEDSYSVDFEVPMDGVSFAFELLNGLEMGQRLKNSLQDAKASMQSKLTQLKEILDTDKIESFTQDIENIERKIVNFKVVVPIIGKFSSGKSKLLNSYIDKERELFAVDTNPTTAKASEIHYAKENYVIVHKKDTTKSKETVLDISNVDMSNISYLQYFLNYPVLKHRQDLVLVDMPGFESSNLNHNDAINHYFNKGQHYILALSCESTNDSSILKHIKEIVSYGADFSILITKIDKMTPANIEKLKQVVTQNIQRVYKQKDFFVGKVSSFEEEIGDFEKIIDGVYTDTATIFEKNFTKEYLTLLNEIQDYYKQLLNAPHDTIALEKKLLSDTKDFEKSSSKLLSKLKDIHYEIVSDGAMRLQERTQKVLKANTSSLVNAAKNNSLSLGITELLRPAINSTFKSILEKSIQKVEDEALTISSDLDIAFTHIQIDTKLSLWESIRNLFSDVESEKIEEQLKHEVIPKVVHDVGTNIKNDLEQIYVEIEKTVQNKIESKKEKTQTVTKKIQHQIAMQTQEFHTQQENLQKSLEKIRSL